MATYEQKKADCVKRMIPFNFTRQEWNEFCKVKSSYGKCAYTGLKFVNRRGHKMQATCERIDQMKPYSPENCVWVTAQANSLKNLYIENSLDSSKLPQAEQGYLTRIKKILLHVENIQEIQKPYKHLFNTESPETLSDEISTEHEQSIEQQQKSSVQVSQEEFEHNNEDIEGKETMTTIYTPVNTEISTARKYAAFGEFIESVCGSEFNLKYAEFSKKVRRKTCSLTNKPIVTQGYFISDKTVPVSNDTFFVVEKSVGEKIDNLMEECKIDFKTMKTLCKNFNKM